MDQIGIDVHKKNSQVCIQTDLGELIERRISTSHEALTKMFSERARARILIEASTESEWVARWLEKLGHEVIVADPNFAAMYATRSRKVKTDRRDARTLCEACRLGAYRPAHRASDEARHRRAQVAVREALVRTRTKFISLTRALLRREGIGIRSGGTPTFAKRVEELTLPAHLALEVAPLLTMLEQLTAQIRFRRQTPRRAREGRRSRRAAVHRSEHRAGDRGDLRRGGGPSRSLPERVAGAGVSRPGAARAELG